MLHHPSASLMLYLKEVEYGCRHEEQPDGRKVVCVFHGWKARAWLSLLSYLPLRKVLEVPGTTVWEENAFVRRRGGQQEVIEETQLSVQSLHWLSGS